MILTDPDLSVRARIGLLVLASDQTLERELQQLTDANATRYFRQLT